jgi:L-phenylalanine/L-methionine N-acetyltransferase
MLQNPSLGTPVRVRVYEDRDLEAVFEIFDQPKCRCALGRDPWGTSVALKAWFDVLPAATLKVVATRGDAPVGIGILAPDAGSRAHVGTLCLFVHDGHHRKGIGAMLLRVLVVSAERFYFLQRLELVVVCDNPVAVKLYEKFGFRIDGRQVGGLCYGGAFRDTYTMSRLGPGLRRTFGANAAAIEISPAPPRPRAVCETLSAV